jgi:pilus assembly protein FimV
MQSSMMPKASRRAVLLLALLPSLARALGLGEIRLSSALNAPLDAQIELLANSPEELAGLKATVASADTFARYGLERPAFLNNVTMTLAKSRDGRDVLNLRSAETMTEPFLTLLIEANWPRGRLVREYTMLFDPPIFGAKAADAPMLASVPAASPVAVRAPSLPAPEPAPAPEPEVAPATPRAADLTTYRVQRGDSLSRIVRKMVPGGPRAARQAMVAIYRANPSAFEHNMNLLRAGAVLRIPEGMELRAVPAKEASREVNDEYHSWRDHGAPKPAGAPTHADLDALRRRVNDLQTELAASQRQLEARSADLAALQAKLEALLPPIPAIPAATALR